MNEAELLEALATQVQAAFACVETWLALTFGYLTVAYFAGAKLSRFQCAAISGLYAVMASLSAAGAPAHVKIYF
jgi:hypothetical protein